MAAVFDFHAGKQFHFTGAFAERFGGRLDRDRDRVHLPESLGEGLIQEVYLNNGFSLCLHHYTLKEELILQRRGTNDPAVLTMKFDGRKAEILPVYPVEGSLFSNNKVCEVAFGTSNFFSTLKLPPREEMSFVAIVTTRSALLDLLQLGGQGVEIENTIRDNPSFVFHEGMTLEMERVLAQLFQIDDGMILPALVYKTKVQELICLLFNRLFSRKQGAAIAVDPEDVQRIYKVRAWILSDLSTPPQLPELAKNIGMSSTKLKLLFRQVFGDSIYNYFQVERMNEAAQLLRNHTVSQVGYRVGFSNLSHFTRLFEKHHRMKPKRYKHMLEQA